MFALAGRNRYALGNRLEDAAAALTAHRRATRRPHPDHEALPVVFNDFLNCLMADPSTERLFPLIEAAATAGAEIFCIDAGWYDDSDGWWDAVGEWRPSTRRFPERPRRRHRAHPRRRHGARSLARARSGRRPQPGGATHARRGVLLA